MRKWIFAFLLAGILVIVGIYIFIPSTLKLASNVAVNVSPEAAYRLLLDDATWAKWWPGENTKRASGSFVYQDANYHLDRKLFNAFLIGIKKEDQSLNSRLFLLPLKADSLAIQWSTEIKTTSNPFTKLQRYFIARALKEDMSQLLNTLKAFFEKQENIYGIVIEQTKVKDSVLVATRMTTDHYPETEEIYALVQKLRTYIEKGGVRENDFPMLHVDSSGGQFVTMVAIPTSRLLEGDNQDILLKRMVLGNILVTEVKGGPQTIKEAFRQLQLYVNEYNRLSPAIPYESLVTDRSKEPDTAKWITRIYYPVY
jgi:hypothetical protein